MRNKLIIVGNTRGGVGKTTTALSLVDMMRGAAALRDAPEEVARKAAHKTLMPMLEAAASPVRAFDVDVEPNKATGHSSLSRRVKDCLSYALQPTPEEIAENPNAVYAHFDDLNRMLMESEVAVADFGANVLNNLLAWAATSGAGRQWRRNGTDVRFVMVTDADQTSLLHAVDGLEKMQAICDESDVSLTSYLVLNRRKGDFDRFKDTEEYERLTAVRSLRDTIDMPPCNSELREPMDMTDRPPSEILRLTEDELIELFAPSFKDVPVRVQENQIFRGSNFFVAWYTQLLSEFLRVGLLGEEAPSIEAPEEPKKEKKRNTAPTE